MITLQLSNFGGFQGDAVHELKTVGLPNGWGKTSLINAYNFAITGKTLNGFNPKNLFSDDKTSVTLYGLAGLPSIRRDLNASGTTLYIGGTVMTQTEFEIFLHGYGVNYNVLRACGNANFLTSDSLDAETLRKLLTNLEYIESDEYVKLKKELTTLRASLREAETLIGMHIVIPQRTVAPLTQLEKTAMITYEHSMQVINTGVQEVCPTCGRKHSDTKLLEKRQAYNSALKVKEDYDELYGELVRRKKAFDDETFSIDVAERNLANAQAARQRVIDVTKRINEINAILSGADALQVSMALPLDMELVTEERLKNGTVKPTCVLYHKGVPLRNVNYSERIKMCVKLLHFARAINNMESCPIIVDNAESVVNHDIGIDNVIWLSAE